jgi:hypothetical protein
MSLTYDKSDDPYVPPSPMTKTKMTTWNLVDNTGDDDDDDDDGPLAEDSE